MSRWSLPPDTMTCAEDPIMPIFAWAAVFPHDMRITAVPWDDPVKHPLHISRYSGISVLVDGYFRRYVGSKNSYKCFINNAFHDYISPPSIGFYKFGPGSGLYAEILHGSTPYPNRGDFEAESFRRLEKSRERLPFPRDGRLEWLLS